MKVSFEVNLVIGSFSIRSVVHTYTSYVSDLLITEFKMVVYYVTIIGKL